MSSPKDQRPRILEPQPYGDLTALNGTRRVLDAAGEDVLTEIVGDYLDLLETSSSIYEANGDYALGIFSSAWCRFLDSASRALCGTPDNASALTCGKWLCQEECWRASRLSMETNRAVDLECPGGIRLYALPILAGNEVVGSINFGYGSPPLEPARLRNIAEKYEVGEDDLLARAREYTPRPPEVIEAAKRRLHVSARLIGALVERADAEKRSAALNGELRDRVAELALSRERLDLVLDSVNVGLWYSDLPSHKMGWNAICKRHFGLPPDAEVDLDLFYSLIHPEDRERVRSAVADSLANRKQLDVEFRAVGRDGVTRCIREIANPHYGEGGEPIRFDGITIDVTEERLRAEAALQSQKLESIGLLAGGVAHDFNNLLTSILGNASLALGSAEPRGRQNLEFIISAAERAADLTRQLLAYAGKGSFVIEDVSLPSVIGETAELLRVSVPKKIEISIEQCRDIPEIKADRSQMQQVLLNLIVNASEAIGDQAGHIRIRTAVEQIASPRRTPFGGEAAPGAYVVLEVSDDGCGMADEVKARIFDPFFSTKFTGRGLGLAAVAGIVRSYSGTLEVESAAGAGTTLRVYFPAGAARVAPAVLRPGSSVSSGTAATVLVVDDEAYVREFLQSALEKRGYSVLAAANGREALEIVRAHPRIDLILLDVVMPVMAGTEFLEALDGVRPGTRVLLTSAWSHEEARRICSVHHGIDFIQKPYTAAALASKVESVLRRK